MLNELHARGRKSDSDETFCPTPWTVGKKRQGKKIRVKTLCLIARQSQGSGTAVKVFEKDLRKTSAASRGGPIDQSVVMG